MFVSVKEAVELTGKSQTTIYRLCKKRSHTRYVKKKDNKYFIDKAYLLATYPPVNNEIMEIDKQNPENTVVNTPQDDLIEFSIENTTDNTDEKMGEKVIDEISEKITERFKQNEAEVLETNEKNAGESKLSWETLIGVSIGLMLITGFILVLYYYSK